MVFLAAACEAKYSGGTGEPNTPYRIANAADLLLLAADANDYDKCFVLTADIDLNPNLPGGRVFTTAVIAPDTESANFGIFNGELFSGVFDGAGHKIINMTIDTGGARRDFLGLFGCTDSACQIKNLALENVIVIGDGDSYYIAGLVGSNSGDINACTLLGDIVNGNLSDYIGGLVGGNFGSIGGCSVEAGVIGGIQSDRLGGLAGYNNGSINDCFSNCEVENGSNSTQIGGFVGRNSGAINRCSSAGNITDGNSSTYLGGLAGRNYGPLGNSYSTVNAAGANLSSYIGGLAGSNNGSISKCYSTGIVTGGSFVGGLVGILSSGSVSNSYYLNTRPINGVGIPLSDEQMKQQASFLNWDFTGIWQICETTNYPKLLWQIPTADFLCPDGVTFVDFSYFASHWRQTDYGDVNGLELTGDGKISWADFAVIALWWGQVGCGECGGADYSDDGKVDIADLNIFCKNWLAVDYGNVEGAELTGDGVVDIADLLAFAEQWLTGF